MRIALRVVCSTLMLLFIFGQLVAHANGNNVKICGDYHYTPLPGFLTKDSTISPGATWLYLNMPPERPTQEDIDTPTIYCLTEENLGNYEYKFNTKEDIFQLTLAKHETRWEISEEKCDMGGKEKVYFLSSWNKTYYTFIVVEVNDVGNNYDSIFVIQPGTLDNDIDPYTENASNEKQLRMCSRATELINTIVRR